MNQHKQLPDVTVVNNKENDVNTLNIKREVKSKKVKMSVKSANMQKEDQDFIDEEELEREAAAKEKERTLIKLPKVFSKPRAKEDFKVSLRTKSLKCVKVVNKAALQKKLLVSIM